MKGFCLEVSGAYACFTRPEMKVERVSYDVITPSAARAIFDAILWKPAIFWRVNRIEVLAPIRWISIRRNEVAAIASPRRSEIFIEKMRQQKAGLLLRDVKYRIFAEFDFIPPEKRVITNNSNQKNPNRNNHFQYPPKDENPSKYAAMFERRAGKGQFFNQPYLGCREFSAQFRLVDAMKEPANPICETRDLGWMLYDMDYSDLNDIKPAFFRAKLNEGVLDLHNIEVHS